MSLEEMKPRVMQNRLESVLEPCDLETFPLLGVLRRGAIDWLVWYRELARPEQREAVIARLRQIEAELRRRGRNFEPYEVSEK